MCKSARELFFIYKKPHINNEYEHLEIIYERKKVMNTPGIEQGCPKMQVNALSTGPRK